MGDFSLLEFTRRDLESRGSGGGGRYQGESLAHQILSQTEGSLTDQFWPQQHPRNDHQHNNNNGDPGRPDLRLRETRGSSSKRDRDDTTGPSDNLDAESEFLGDFDRPRKKPRRGGKQPRYQWSSSSNAAASPLVDQDDFQCAGNDGDEFEEEGGGDRDRSSVSRIQETILLQQQQQQRPKSVSSPPHHHHHESPHNTPSPAGSSYSGRSSASNRSSFVGNEGGGSPCDDLDDLLGGSPPPSPAPLHAQPIATRTPPERRALKAGGRKRALDEDGGGDGDSGAVMRWQQDILGPNGQPIPMNSPRPVTRKPRGGKRGGGGGGRGGGRKNGGGGDTGGEGEGGGGDDAPKDNLVFFDIIEEEACRELDDDSEDMKADCPLCDLDQDHGSNQELAEGVRQMDVFFASLRTGNTRVMRALKVANKFEEIVRRDHNKGIMERVTAAPTQEDKNKILKDERLIKFLTPKQAWWHEYHRKDQETKQLLMEEMITARLLMIMKASFVRNNDTGEERLNDETNDAFRNHFMMWSTLYGKRYLNPTFSGTSAASLVGSLAMSSMCPVAARTPKPVTMSIKLLDEGMDD